MKLILFLLLIRYLLRLIPASMLGGMLIMEDLNGRQNRTNKMQNGKGPEKDHAFSGPSVDHSLREV